MRRIWVAHSSALCHPADICYICMAAGDPWIKRLQEYCHISFNNIIILWGKRCFIPDALQSLACGFHLTLSLSASRLRPSSLSSSLSSSPPFPSKLSLFCCDALELAVLSNLVEQDIVCAEHCGPHYLPDSPFLFFPFKAIWSCESFISISPRSLEQPTKTWETSNQML